MAVFKCCNPRIQVPTNMYVKAKKRVNVYQRKYMISHYIQK